MIIAIDFDGTIVEHRYPDIGRPVIGAFAWMRTFQNHGAKLILFTMRSGKSLDEAVEFCRKNGIEFWGVNTNPEQRNWTTSPKAYARLYIDDAAFGCPLINCDPHRPCVDWSVVGPAVEKLLR